MQRYFSKEKINSTLVLNDNDIHHIKNVMRMNKDDNIEVVCDKKTYLCSINDQYNANIIKKIEENNELDVQIILAMALVKEQKQDLILQKATELGVSTIIPVSMQRCVIKLDNKTYKKKQQRWQSICKEASEQSKRNIIPNITEIMALKDLVKVDADLKLVCSISELKKYLNISRQKGKTCDKIIIVVGPEGGITIDEENFLVQNNFEKVSLGPRILRAETAAIYALSILNYNFMR